MYSVVLMAAMGTGGDVAGWGNGGGCWGNSCHGYACSGYSCHGNSCHGCCGGKAGFFGGLFNRGGCHGSSCHGCWGSSCHGSSCHGYSCSGYSCHGGSCHGCGGGKAGFFGGLFNRGGCHGSSCHGGCYGGGCYGGGCYGGYEAAPVVTPAPVVAPVPAEKTTQGASLKFVVPAGTRLYVDGRLTTVEGTERVFQTPAVEAGQLFYYDVTAEIEVAGNVVVEQKRVLVRAGASVEESFGKLLAAAGQPAVFAAK